MTAIDRPLFAVPPGTVYLDSAAQGPRLHAVLAAGHAALDPMQVRAGLRAALLPAQQVGRELRIEHRHHVTA